MSRDWDSDSDSDDYRCRPRRKHRWDTSSDSDSDDYRCRLKKKECYPVDLQVHIEPRCQSRSCQFSVIQEPERPKYDIRYQTEPLPVAEVQALQREVAQVERQRDLEQRVTDQNVELLKLREEVEKLRRLQNEPEKAAAICSVCMEKGADMLPDGCDHISTCTECIKEIQTCPICRAPFKIAKKVFIAI